MYHDTFLCQTLSMHFGKHSIDIHPSASTLKPQTDWETLGPGIYVDATEYHAPKPYCRPSIPSHGNTTSRL